MASLLSTSGFHLMRPKNSISSSAIASTAASVISSSVFCILVFTSATLKNEIGAYVAAVRWLHTCTVRWAKSCLVGTMS
jgi:hypothetical protein